MALLQAVLLFTVASISASDSPVFSQGFDFNYQNLKDDIYEQPINMMGAKTPHEKEHPQEESVQSKLGMDSWAPYDFSKFDAYLNTYKDTAAEQNRIKRSPKTRRRGRSGRRRNKQRTTTTPSSSDDEDGKHGKNGTDEKHEYGDLPTRRKEKKKKTAKHDMDIYTTEDKEFEKGFVEMPKDLYQAHLRPGVIFRIHMTEAITKMQYRNYAEDKDESVIEADVEYLRLTRKVINDEITKFEDLKWLMNWFNNRSELIQEHSCNTRYYAVGIPPTMFTHSEEYMKRMCLFDNVYIDHIPYVIGEDNSLMAAVAPPVLHCDAATCTSVPFIDSVMFDERLSRSNVRSITPCQASCRAHCRNRVDCLQRCSERCRRLD